MKNRHNISILNNKLSLKIDDISMGHYSYAAYLFDDEDVCIEKRWYQDQQEFSFDFVLKGRYYFKIFRLVKGGSEKTSWRTEFVAVDSASKDDGAEMAITQSLIGKDIARNLRRLIFDHPTYLSRAFQLVRGAVHSSSTWKDKRLFAQELLNVGEEPGLYAGSAELVAERFSQISRLLDARTDLPEKETLYLRGLLRYRVGDFFSAQLNFQGLLPYSRQLKYHQTSCPAYFYRWDPDSHEHGLALDNFKIYKTHSKPGNGVVLISCDYGYFVSYYPSTIKKLLQYGQTLHLHLILPLGMNVQDLEPFFGDSEVGVSFEYEGNILMSEDNKKTYYTASRYLVCDKVLDLYGKPLLVSDIDISFDRSLDYAFSKLGDYEISLYFGKNDLPWLRIMAGFNFFGRLTAESYFLKYLKSFLVYCLSTGRDGWMLDQTALEVTYQNCQHEHIQKISSIRELLEYSPRQYENRDRFRAMAKKAVTEFRR